MISVESILNSPKSQRADNLNHNQQQTPSGPPVSIRLGRDERPKANPSTTKKHIADNYFLEYNDKVKEIMQALDNVTNYELSQANKTNLPAEYYLLKRNYDVLYSLFKVFKD